MDIEQYFRRHQINIEVRDDGVAWGALATGAGQPPVAVAGASPRFAADDVAIELHRDEAYPADEYVTLLAIVNRWNTSHRLSRARVDVGDGDTYRVVLDAWMPATAGLKQEVVDNFLDSAFYEMMLFWSLDQVAGNVAG